MNIVTAIGQLVKIVVRVYVNHAQHEFLMVWTCVQLVQTNMRRKKMGCRKTYWCEMTDDSKKIKKRAPDWVINSLFCLTLVSLATLCILLYGIFIGFTI